MEQNLVNSLAEAQGFEERLKNDSNYFLTIYLFIYCYLFLTYIYKRL